MTPSELKEARAKLGLSAEALARAVDVSSGRVVRRWESGESAIPGPAATLIWLMCDDNEVKQWVLKNSEKRKKRSLRPADPEH